MLVPNQTGVTPYATGPIDSVDKAISAAQTLPCASVVVTLGADGAVVIANNHVMHVRPPLSHQLIQVLVTLSVQRLQAGSHKVRTS